jgi:DNA-binding transcriptional LysR family regulator
MGLMLRVARQRGELVAVLEAFCPTFDGFFLCDPSRIHSPPKLRALVDYMRARRTHVLLAMPRLRPCRVNP